jgi:hypothetical protein
VSSHSKAVRLAALGFEIGDPATCREKVAFAKKRKRRIKALPEERTPIHRCPFERWKEDEIEPAGRAPCRRKPTVSRVRTFKLTTICSLDDRDECTIANAVIEHIAV